MRLLACIVMSFAMLSLIAVLAVHRDSLKRRLEKTEFRLQHQQTAMRECELAFPLKGKYYDECVLTWGQ